MALFRVEGLPDEALTAAAEFHARVLPEIRSVLDGDSSQLTLVFAPADHTHRAWRLAAVQGLAREYAPIRVNALESEEAEAIAAAAAYLDAAEGVTGQLLPLHGHGAGDVLYVET